jgi:hypothetical protein
MDDREKARRKVLEVLAERLRRYYADLRERYGDAEEFFQRLMQRPKPPDQGRR